MNEKNLSLYPKVLTDIPGPASRDLARRLSRVECPGVTYLAEDFPIFWRRAQGAMVEDVDGNTLLDVTGAFAVANVGHNHPKVVAAIKRQADTLLHGMGDVHPAEAKVLFLETLKDVLPGDLGGAILGSSGSDAVEAARKVCSLHTGRPGLLAFSGAYHGLSWGALELTARQDFRTPFLSQLSRVGRHLPFPNPYLASTGDADCLARSLEMIRWVLDDPGAGGEGIGGIILEPIQGRAGTIVPPRGFLRALREICDERGILLILDEIYTGFGRTGTLFACDHEGVVPDILCLGKGMTGGMPVSACVGTPEVMASMGPTRGEALHTQTFLGHPLGMVAARAAIEVVVEENLALAAEQKGQWLKDALSSLKSRHPVIGDIRGMGLMVGLELVEDPGTRAPAIGLGAELMKVALKRGLLILPSGAQGHILAFAPPLTISKDQLISAVDILDESLTSLGY